MNINPETISLIAGIITLVTGLIFIIGLGWIGFMLDIISALDGTNTTPSNYPELQKVFKDIKYKIIGFILIIIGVILIK